MNEQRLRNAIRAVRESPAPEQFTMLAVFHDCGTPACVAGHYIARSDLQQEFSPEFLPLRREVAAHFDITEKESIELFGGGGCGNAETPEDAARYIEDFIARKLAVEEVLTTKLPLAV